MTKYKKIFIGAGLILGLLLVALWSYYQVIFLPAMTEFFPVTPCPATPACTPDSEGQRIVFSSNPIVYDFFKTESKNIYIMNADGTCTQQLTNFTRRKPLQPQWSPDGTQILFEAHINNDGDLYTVTLTENPQVTRLTWQGRNYAATWSPDGSQIAFVSDRTGYDAFYLMEADGTHERLLAPIIAVGAQERLNSESGTPLGIAHWSPDGQDLAFTGFTPETGERDIYRLHVEDNALTNVTQNDTIESLMAWLPTENVWVFWQDQALFTMNPDGTNVQLVVKEVEIEHGPVNYLTGWTPTLPTQLIFSMKSEVPFVMRFVDLACATDNPSTLEGLSPQCYSDIQEPSMFFSNWYAGGPKLLFTAVRSYPDRVGQDGYDIFTLNYDGTGLTNLTNCSSSAEDPAWSPPP